MGRRLVIVLAVLLVVGTPAAALRASCAGASCRSSDAAAAAPVPFCSLPADLRALITAGTYDGRSPDVVGIAANTQVTTRVSSGTTVTWPSTSTTGRSMETPFLFLGKNIRTAELPAAGLDQLAPTIADAIGLARPHPEVREGQVLDGVVRSGRHAPLVVVIVWKGVGGPDLTGAGTPWLDRWRSIPGATTDTERGGVGVAGGLATAGSLPLDPIAVEATIGSGGLPSQHGITGTWIRNERGSVSRAFGRGSPQPVIATLGDDLDHATHGRALIGLIGSDDGDVGLTGDHWYGTGPVRDRTAHPGHDPAAVVHSFLDRGWGTNGTPDLLAVALDDRVGADDRDTSAIVSEVLDRVPDATVVVTGTGSLRTAAGAATPPAPAGTVRIPAGGVAGGYFLDRTAGAAAAASTVVDAMHTQTGPDGGPLYADAFASYAVRFGRYC